MIDQKIVNRVSHLLYNWGKTGEYVNFRTFMTKNDFDELFTKINYLREILGYCTDKEFKKVVSRLSAIFRTSRFSKYNCSGSGVYI